MTEEQAPLGEPHETAVKLMRRDSAASLANRALLRLERAIDQAGPPNELDRLELIRRCKALLERLSDD